jgi:hypothetical protein
MEQARNIIILIFAIAAAAIGVESYNLNDSLKQEKPHNFNFLIFALVVFILNVLSNAAELAMPAIRGY